LPLRRQFCAIPFRRWRCGNLPHRMHHAFVDYAFRKSALITRRFSTQEKCGDHQETQCDAESRNACVAGAVRRGAIPVDARFVTDGNVTTGAGVSAGLDFGIAVVETLRGKPYAAALMLQAEYHPEPPFAGGTLATTDPAVAAMMTQMNAPAAAAVACAIFPLLAHP